MSYYKPIYKEYCQSCGMPLRFDVEEYLGTNTDHSQSNEYCYYCLKDGIYTINIPIDQMVDIWVKYTDKYNEYSDTDYTPDELRILLNKRLPTLKRWQQKQTTQNIHYKTIEEIRVYIDRNLEKEIDMEKLCHIANLSFFHLRKVFREITGENIGSYIQRLRLEQTAHKLVSTDWPVKEILKECGYQTKSSLAKGFKKHFGISMSAYRERYRFVSPEKKSDQLQPTIKKLNAQKAICYMVGHAFYNRNEYMTIWRKLIHYRNKHMKQVEIGYFISISPDNPLITSPEHCRFYLGILTTANHVPEGKFSVREIPAGFYAVFRYKGNYTGLPDLYRTIYEHWLPKSSYVQRDTLSFEVYLNSPRDTELSELLTEIYIPIDKI